jgi:hypothetical protein
VAFFGDATFCVACRNEYALHGTGDASARLWLRVDRPQGEQPGFFDNMSSRMPGALPQWTDFEIVGDVADDAEGIAFGMLFTGDGTAWIDEASLEVVP